MVNDVMELDEFISLQKGRTTFSDVKNIIDSLLDRKKIDMITRIRDVELDKICLMLHHSHQLSVKMNLHLGNDGEDTEMCSPHRFILQNLFLRLSLDSQSRKEFENIFISLIKTEISLMKKENEQEGGIQNAQV